MKTRIIELFTIAVLLIGAITVYAADTKKPEDKPQAKIQLSDPAKVRDRISTLEKQMADMDAQYNANSKQIAQLQANQTAIEKAYIANSAAAQELKTMLAEDAKAAEAKK